MIAILESIVNPLFSYTITVYVNLLAIYGNYVASIRACARFKDLVHDTRFDTCVVAGTNSHVVSRAYLFMHGIVISQIIKSFTYQVYMFFTC